MTRIGVHLVLNRDLVQQQQRILHLGVLLLAVLAAQVVQPRDLVEDDVDDGDEDRHTDRVRPDDDDGDDIRVAVTGAQELGLGDRAHHAAARARQPAEEAEEGRQDVDDEDRADQLPRGPGFTAARDEDQPVLGQRHLEEEDLLDGAVMLDDAAVLEEHGAADDPGGDGEETAEDDGYDPDFAELPFDGTGFNVSVIVGDSDSGKIGEEL